ncbi:MAG: cytochrome bc complex cytochrome b subunit [Polyangiaceae bacterium]
MSLRDWLSDRLPVDQEKLRELTNEPVPNHMKRWWFALGGTPAYLFIVQVVTGILLAIHYQGSAETAYESVQRITGEVSYGWYLRSLHKWAATLMVAAVILHQMRVFFTGAYRKPREINWLVGCCILICTLLAGFTGYSLVYEQLSYWGATVGANIAKSVPVVGESLRGLLLGGETYGKATLPRFYVLHAAVLPAAIIVLVMLHIAIIRVQGVSELRFEDEPAEEKKHFNFIPDHLFTEIIMGLVLMVVLTTLAIVFPAELGPKANPLVTPEVIKPEWFFYVAFRWLKLFSGTVALLSMGFIIFAMFAWPFIDAWIRKHTKFREASVLVGALAALAIMGLTVWEAVVAH